MIKKDRSIEMIHIIFTLAGSYQRFKSEGFRKPKFFLPIFGFSSILDKIVEGFVKGQINVCLNYIFNETDKNYIDHEYICKISRGKPNNVFFTENTNGQAETVRVCLEKMSIANPETDFDNDIFFVMNGDTIFDPHFSELCRAFSQNKDSVALVDIFYSKSKDHSYVHINENGEISKMVEKKVISPFASTGLYGFKTSKIFLSTISNIRNTKQEVHVSHVIDKMIKSHQAIAILDFADKEVLDLGTPEKYFNYLKN